MSGSPDAALAAAYEHCQALVREGDRDRWLATLFVPAAARPHIFALLAFSLEVASVRERVSEPLLGEVRYQWWRDALAGAGQGEVEANPIAAALGDTIRRFHLPVKALVDLIEARAFDLYDDPMPTLGDLEGYAGETVSSLMRLAALVLADGREPGGADAVGHAGVAYAIAGLLRALPWHAARGQVYLPADLLARHGVSREDVVSGRDAPNLRAALGELRTISRRHMTAALAAASAMDAGARPALLPLALVPAYLKAMDQPGYRPFQSVVEIPSWRRVAALWAFSRRL